jgi:hypothetical protein
LKERKKVNNREKAQIAKINCVGPSVNTWPDNIPIYVCHGRSRLQYNRTYRLFLFGQFYVLPFFQKF